jgi:hypothetical protein
MKLRIAVLALALFCASCGTPQANTPAPVQNSPQTTVTLTSKTVADAASAGVQTVISLRNAGKLSQANTTTIENWLGFVATTDKQVNTILANGQAWPAQKAQILTLLATVTAPQIATAIDPGAQAVIAQVMTLVAQIRTQVTP